MLNHLGFFFFFAFFFIFFSKVRVGAKEGGSHYWEMAVAITCGYGGYLLPLLAAHSSFICNSFGQNFHMHFRRVTFYWIGIEIMFWKKAVTWTTMNIAVLITNNHTLACISVKCLQMDFVSSQSIEHSKRNLRKVVTLTTIWCPWTLNHHNSLTGYWDWCSSRKGCNLDNHQGCHLDDTSWITNIILNTYFQIQHDSLKSTAC